MRKPACSPGSRLRYRANIKLANQQDKLLNLEICQQGNLLDLQKEKANNLGSLTYLRNELRVVDLFAGAGGMGLGFLMANSQKKGFRIIQAAELNPIYVKSLEKNHQYFSQHTAYKVDDCSPKEFSPIDLSSQIGRNLVKEAVDRAGGVDILIGGPPCQGFSQSNRNSWSPENPYNKLVEMFVKCAVELEPKVILMENVQGILWTPRPIEGKAKELGVVDYVSKKLMDAGYILFPAVVDAAWYGVPQHRNRFFLLALHRSMGYTHSDFGEWGAFPKPTHGSLGKYDYVTVQDAIADLPRVNNGENRVIQEYQGPSGENLRINPFLSLMRQMAPKETIEGHIVSRQADYVIERYKNIPQGGNWQNIRHMMDNYKDISRTHSNIYRRLRWSEPSITIGNYRKSMIIHPIQDRGLSLREAARLQSLPDWFTFCGSVNDSVTSGIMHKQQQLANAVSFLLTRAIADYILKL
ncbi:MULTISPECIES: DNA cytosine methyltransferase [Trichocoleus]|uniref:Cytosine-specific methyltransferase n=1 Tax=Trichocoleus desertorum GB2-A4 TaxID=2933944 RepID=A0ABV0JF60_9CYAN|nr:DNA cytosine methyltransferase [Trichocoleus sp. FACHB-46]MBD1862338.1 DNA cytosine methyltransferase [Trichocoleus sp. FACHB-46]